MKEDSVADGFKRIIASGSKALFFGVDKRMRFRMRDNGNRVQRPKQLSAIGGGLVGIVGMVQLDNCVTSSRSKWFHGPVGWLLSKPKKLPFMPLKGQLGLFDPPARILNRLRARSR